MSEPTKKPLKIYLLEPRGFCAGVDRALDTVEKALEIFGAPIYVKHEIVHNRFVVERLAKRGVIFVEELAEVPDHSVLIFSAHGIPLSTRLEARNRPLRVIDATCPLVTKVHLEVHRLHKEGYEIILIGHKGHVEVIGTMGQVPEGVITLVGNPKEAEAAVVKNPDKVRYVTQTTLSVEDTQNIVAVLKRRFPKLEGPPRKDICYATQNRQNAVGKLGNNVDVILVIGSKNSSNSNRLVEVARSKGIEAHLIDTPEEIEPKWFVTASSIGVTAGASAPEDLVQATIDYLRRNYGGEVEKFGISEEDVVFTLPSELSELGSTE